MSEELDVDKIQAAVAIWKAYGDKPCRPPYLVPSNEEIQAAYVLADAFIILDEELKSDNTVELIEAMNEGFAVRLADVEARAEAVKNDFATRLADAEDKAERYRLALEKCRRIIEAGSRPALDISDMHWTIAEALK